MKINQVYQLMANHLSSGSPQHKAAACHSRTIKHFLDGGKDTDRIIIFAVNNGFQVIHSLVADDQKVIADSYSRDGTFNIKSFDPHSGTIAYESHPMFKKAVKPFIIMTFAEFKAKHVKTVASFKEYLERNQ